MKVYTHITQDLLKLVKKVIPRSWLFPYSFKLLTSPQTKLTRPYNEVTSPIDHPNLDLIPINVLGPWCFRRRVWLITDPRFIQYQFRVVSFWFIAGNGLIIQTASNSLTNLLSLIPRSFPTYKMDFIKSCSEALATLLQEGLLLVAGGQALRAGFWGKVFNLGKKESRVTAQLLASAMHLQFYSRTLTRLRRLAYQLTLSHDKSPRFTVFMSLRKERQHRTRFIRQSLVVAVCKYNSRNPHLTLANLPLTGTGLTLWVEVLTALQLMSQSIQFTLTHLNSPAEEATIQLNKASIKWPKSLREQSPFLKGQLFDINYIKREKIYTKLKYSRSPQYDIVSGGIAALLSAFIGFLISEKFGYELPDSGDFYIVFMYIVFLCFSLRPLVKLVGVLSRAEAFGFSQSRQTLMHFWRRVRWTPITWKWAYQFWRRGLITTLRVVGRGIRRIREVHIKGFEFVMACEQKLVEWLTHTK